MEKYTYLICQKQFHSLCRSNTTLLNRYLVIFLIVLSAIFCKTQQLRADTWKRVTPSGAIPSARSGHSMVPINGKLYMYGGDGNSIATTGENPGGAVLLNDLWDYVEESDEWQQVVPHTPLKARKNHAAVTYGDKMCIFFGQGDQGPLGDIWAYDPASQYWQEMQAQGIGPGPRSGHSAVVAGDTVYLFGGQDKYGIVYGDLWTLDLRTRIWNKQAGYSLPSEGHRAVTDGAKMYVYGGDNGQLVYDHLLTYDFAAKIWQKITPQSDIPAARTYPIVTLDANKLIISGGRGQTKELGDTWQYDIVTNQWVCKADGPVQSKAAAAVVSIGSTKSMFSTSSQAASYILLFGGERNGLFLNETWKYSASRKPMPAINLLLFD